MSEKVVKAAGDNYGQHPVGTGPFMFDSWISADRIVLKKQILIIIKENQQ